MRRKTMALSWLVLIAFTAVSSWYNREFVTTVSHGTPRDEWTHAGLPVTLLIAVVLFELVFVTRSHGVTKGVGLVGLAAIAIITFAASYLGILSVLSDDPATLAWAANAMTHVVKAVAAVPDILMLTATALLISLRSKASKGEDEETATHRGEVASAATGAMTAAFGRLKRKLDTPIPAPSAVETRSPETSNADFNAVPNAVPETSNAGFNAVGPAPAEPSAQIPSAATLTWEDTRNAAPNAVPGAAPEQISAVTNADQARGFEVSSADQTRFSQTPNAVTSAVDNAGQTRELAERIKATANMRTPLDQVVAVLTADDDEPGLSAERVADSAGIKHHSTVTKIRDHRRRIERRLTTVG